MELVLADIKEAHIALDIIKSRMKWMDENDIHHWNDYKYDELYPLSYYEEKASNKELYFLKDNDKFLACGCIFLNDIRWTDNKKAFYIHNFASIPSDKSYGKDFISLVIKKAMNENINLIRLDCSEDNNKLNIYYDSLGFTTKGKCVDGFYHGNLKELDLKNKAILKTDLIKKLLKAGLSAKEIADLNDIPLEDILDIINLIK